MQKALQIQNLAVYLAQSEILYYLQIDLYGNCKYVNPLLQNSIGMPAGEFEQVSLAKIFSESETYSFRNACENCLQQPGGMQSVELLLTRKDDTACLTKWEISVCNDLANEEKLIQAVGFVTDSSSEISSSLNKKISFLPEKRIEEKQLKQSELFYKNLIAESLDGIVLSDVDGIIDFASPCIKRILGYDVEEVLGRTLFSFAHPDDIELAAQTFNDEIKSQQEVKFINIRLVKKSGGFVWCIIRGHNMLSNPYVGKMVIYFSDDTLRKSAEQALIESEKKFREQATIITNVTDVIVTTDLERRVTSWNIVIEKLTGITEKDAIGKKIQDVIDKDYSPYTHDQVTSIVREEGIWRGEVSFSCINGKTIYLLHTVSMLHSENGDSIGMLGVGKDITERKKAEKRLQKSELFYRRLSYYSIDGIIMADERGTITYSGPSVEGISGYEPVDLLGHNFFEFVHPDDIPAATDAFFKELSNKSIINYLLLRLKHSNGEWTWCTVRGHNLLNIPELKTFVIYFTNDTKRKRVEDELRKSEENFRSLITNLKQGVILLDKDAIVTLCNVAALEMLGLTEKDILGKPLLQYSFAAIRENGQDFPSFEFPISVLLRTGQSAKDVVIGVYRESTQTRVWVMVNANPIFGTDGNLSNIICSFIDVTEQKRLSKELLEQEVQKQKLLVRATIDGQEKERQEIGKELHDNINQYLTTARLYLEVAKEKSVGEVKEMIHLSHKTLSDIVSEIRKLSQSLVPPTLGDIGLVESVQELCDSIRQAHTIHIEFHYRYFDENQLTDNLKLMFFRIIQEQLNNIIRHSEALQMEIDLQSDAESVNLTIKDNGKGFETARYKKGRGLSNISSRANLLNGKMTIESAPGQGCRIIISVPIEEEEKGLI